MFSSSRTCLSTTFKKAPSSWIPSQSPEPLLFLYPRWFATTSRRLQQAAALLQTSGQDPSGTADQDDTVTEAQESSQPSIQNGHISRVQSSKWPIKPSHVETPDKGRLFELFRQSREGNPRDVNPQSRKRKSIAMKTRFHPTAISMMWIANKLHQLEEEVVPSDHNALDETTLHLRQETVSTLAGTLKENMWIYHIGTGCEVHVLPSYESDQDGLRNIILRGSQAAREAAKKDLLTFEVFVRSQSVAKGPSPVRESKFAISELGKRREALYQPDNDVGVRDFMDVVKNITSMQMSRGSRRHLFADGSTKNETIASALLELFGTRRSRYASVAAVNEALRFLNTHTELTGTLALVHARAKELGLKLDIQSYNTLLESAMKGNDEAKINSLLSEMRRSRIGPDGKTWATLLSHTRTLRECQQLLAYAKKIQMLKDPYANNSFAQAIVERMFPKVLYASTGVRRFINFMDAALGEHWMSVRPLNRMIYYCSEYSNWEAASQLMTYAKSRQVELTSTTLTYLLHLTRRKGSIKSSILLLQSDLASMRGRNDHLAIPFVFATAWQRRCHNVCRVLWYYAASHGIITYTMQNMVATSLLEPMSEKPATRKGMWYASAGKVIAGLPVDTQARVNRAASAASLPANATEILSNFTPVDGARWEQRNLAYKVMENDLKAWRYLKPMPWEQLLDRIEQAYAMDIDWRRNMSSPEMTVADMLQKAIDVPLCQLDRPREPTVRAADISGDPQSSISTLCQGGPDGTFDHGDSREPKSAEHHTTASTDVDVIVITIDTRGLRRLPSLALAILQRSYSAIVNALRASQGDTGLGGSPGCALA